MDNQDKIAYQAEIARLIETIKWYQGRTGITMGEAAKAGIAGAPVQGAGVIPEDVRNALDRMCLPLDASRLSGVTAAEDARCMAVIKEYIERSAAPAAPSEQAEPVAVDIDSMAMSAAERIVSMLYEDIPGVQLKAKIQCEVHDAMAAYSPSAPSYAFHSDDDLIVMLDSLHEMDENGAVSNLKWSAAQRAIAGIRSSSVAQLAVPNALLEDLKAIDRAMQHMGDTLNNMDVVDAGDEDIAAPGFAALAKLLSAAASPSPAPAQQQEPSELLIELRRWAGEDAGYAACMILSAANEIERLNTAKSHLILQAQIWHSEAKSQRATVIGILARLGLPENDWEAKRLIVAYIAKLTGAPVPRVGGIASKESVETAAPGASIGDDPEDRSRDDEDWFFSPNDG